MLQRLPRQGVDRLEPPLLLHGQLAHMTGNPILELMMGLIGDLLETSRSLFPSPIDTSEEAGQQVLQDHRALVEAVSTHDPRRSETLMRQHLKRVSKLESQAL